MMMVMALMAQMGLKEAGYGLEFGFAPRAAPPRLHQDYQEAAAAAPPKAN